MESLSNLYEGRRPLKRYMSKKIIDYNCLNTNYLDRGKIAILMKELLSKRFNIKTPPAKLVDSFFECGNMHSTYQLKSSRGEFDLLISCDMNCTRGA